MSHKTSSKKLSLKRESLRTLSDDQLTNVAGGAYYYVRPKSYCCIDVGGGGSCAPA